MHQCPYKWCDVILCQTYREKLEELIQAGTLSNNIISEVDLYVCSTTVYKWTWYSMVYLPVISGVDNTLENSHFQRIYDKADL